MTDKQQMIERIGALQPLRQLVDSMDMRARKSLGQNFLFDLNLTRRCAFGWHFIGTRSRLARVRADTAPCFLSAIM